MMAQSNQGRKICLEDHHREMWVAARLAMGYETRMGS
jgi:hypothetical protein